MRGAAFTCFRLADTLFLGASPCGALCSSKEAGRNGQIFWASPRHGGHRGDARGRRCDVRVGVGVRPWASLVAAPSSSAHHRAGGGHSPRVGGRVHSAWPKTGHAPKTQLTRWLARQVGATKPLACAKRWRKARARCHLAAPKRSHHHVARDAVMSSVLGDPGSPSGKLANIAAGTHGAGGLRARASDNGDVSLPLQLVRSYEIPADDPLYNSLSNWSWTYDSAVAAAAFAATGDQANSQQLLDQLSRFATYGWLDRVGVQYDHG